MKDFKRNSMIGIIAATALLSACGSNQSTQNQGEEPGVTTQAENTATPSETSENNEDENIESADTPDETGKDELGEIIEEQSFDTTLDGWGDVRFVSLRPEDSGDSGNQDVRFKLLQDGKEIYSFPGKNEDNTIYSDKFIDIAAVAFKDYNEDGKKDVILIIQYEPESGDADRYYEVRTYYQNEGEKEFTMDSALDEFLMKQHYSDTIDSVMKGAKEYQDYSISMNEGSIPAQIELIASQEAVWLQNFDPDYDVEPKFYTVTDLDGNGRLEVISSICAGTGLYTTSSYYEVNDSFDGLTLCEQSIQEGDSEADIITDEVTAYYDEASNIIYYIFGDLIRNGAAEYYESKRAIWLQDGKLKEDYIANKSTIYQDAENFTIMYTGTNGQMISEEDYDQAEDKKYGDLSKIDVKLLWNQFDTVEELKELSQEELIKNLDQSYATFQRME